MEHFPKLYFFREWRVMCFALSYLQDCFVCLLLLSWAGRLWFRWCQYQWCSHDPLHSPHIHSRPESTHSINYSIFFFSWWMFKILKIECLVNRWSFLSHHASFQRVWSESLVNQLWIDWQLDANGASFGYIQLGNHTPEHHARVEEVWQRVNLLWSKKGTRLMS